ncbi:MAG: hypothetical protein IJ326_12215 [Lachnospiraceae bacterium]|nr:hypothetical protein [Lachnospiraceae bacterium]
MKKQEGFLSVTLLLFGMIKLVDTFFVSKNASVIPVIGYIAVTLIGLLGVIVWILRKK